MLKLIRYWLAFEVVFVLVIALVSTIAAYEPSSDAFEQDAALSAPDDPNVIVGLDDTPVITNLPHYRSFVGPEPGTEPEPGPAQDPNLVRLIANFGDNVEKYLAARRVAWRRSMLIPAHVDRLTRQPVPHNRSGR